MGEREGGCGKRMRMNHGLHIGPTLESIQVNSNLGRGSLSSAQRLAIQIN